MRWCWGALVLALGGCAIPRWPVEGSMSSPFGVRLRGVRLDLHRGVDVAVPVGTPIKAMTHGRVVRAGWAGGYGWMVMLDHGRGNYTIYGHLSEVHVRTGEEVRGGQVIALSGKSGNATGAHLHFEVWRGGRPEDPVPLLGREPKGSR